MTIRERIRPLMEIDPAAGCVEQDGHWYSWGQVRQVVDGIGALLAQAGVAAGTPVALLMRNRAQHVAALAGVLCADTCLLPVNTFTSADKLRADVAELDPAVLVATGEDWALPGLADEAREQRRMAIVIDGDRVRCLDGLERPGTRAYRAPLPGVAIEMLSSGTTGKPKRIRLATANLEKGLISKALVVDGKPALRSSAGLVSAPLVHISGTLWALSHMAEGRASVLLDRFSVESWVGAVKRHRLRYAGLVPTGIKMVLDAGVPKEDLASLIAVRAGTAPLAPELQAAFEERYGIPILNQYGATEFAGGVIGWTLEMRQKYGNSKPGSVGRVNPGVQIRIVDPDEEADVPVGQTGLLWIKAPQLGDREWVKTTDLASMDAEGFVWIRGRADNAIIRGGFKIVPSEVVAILERHPSVRSAAVIGLPDERLGQVPVAAIELSPEAPQVTGDALRAWARDNMTAYFVPAMIKVVERLPRTPSMKVSEPEVRALFAAAATAA